MSAPTAERAALPELVEALRALYARVASTDRAAEEERVRLVTLLGEERWTELPDAPAALPVARHLPEALSAMEGPATVVAGAIRRAAAALPWAYGYAPRADAPHLRGRIAFAEILGPAAPLRCDSVCLGLTLIAPHTRYPLHHHPAVELYLVLAGTATWTAGGHARPVPPLQLVLHPSGIAHAMETEAEPLLAAYAWTGSDVRTSSAYVDGG